MRKVLLIASLFLLAGCTDEKGATSALSDAGLTPVNVGGYPLWGGCGKDDAFATKFIATNAQGKRVTGVVCSGWFKGKTVRFD